MFLWSSSPASGGIFWPWQAFLASKSLAQSSLMRPCSSTESARMTPPPGPSSMLLHALSRATTI
eukprot:8386959-Pyramimonas_sp.AAC.1